MPEDDPRLSPSGFPSLNDQEARRLATALIKRKKFRRVLIHTNGPPTRFSHVGQGIGHTHMVVGDVRRRSMARIAIESRFS